MSSSVAPLIIFDWDGTLMDSVPRIVSCMQKMALAAGLAVPAESAVRDIIGLSLPVALVQLFDCHEPAEQAGLIAFYRHYYVDEDPTPSPLFEGVEDMLTDLKQQGAILAVATGKARPGLLRAWAETGTEHFFSSSRCASEAQSKPHPEMLQLILSEQQQAAERSLMVGDSKFDLRMANSINMPSVGVTYGVHCQHTLSRENPEYIADNIETLHAWLSSTQF